MCETGRDLIEIYDVFCLGLCLGPVSILYTYRKAVSPIAPRCAIPPTSFVQSCPTTPRAASAEDTDLRTRRFERYDIFPALSEAHTLQTVILPHAVQMCTLTPSPTESSLLSLSFCTALWANLKCHPRCWVIVTLTSTALDTLAESALLRLLIRPLGRTNEPVDFLCTS